MSCCVAGVSNGCGVVLRVGVRRISRCEIRRRENYVMQDPTSPIRERTYKNIQQPQWSPMAVTRLFANFQGFVDANIKTFLHMHKNANMLLAQQWRDFKVRMD